MTDYRLIVSLYQITHENLKMTATCLAATSALVDALAEEFPDLASRYETLRQESAASSLQAQRIRELCRLCDGVILKMKDAGIQPRAGTSGEPPR